MKKVLTLLFVTVVIAACMHSNVDEVIGNRTTAPDALMVGFDAAGDDTRVELMELDGILKSVWTKGDQLSVFHRSYVNLRYEYQGETGERNGLIKYVDGDMGEQTMDNILVVYPYDETYRVNLSGGSVELLFPATQYYKESSYGNNGNVMVASSDFNSFMLRSICGWVAVQMSGDGDKVVGVKLSGNCNEQVAGICFADCKTAVAIRPAKVEIGEDAEIVGSFDESDRMFTEVYLDCGEGVELHGEPTSFYLALLPQTFEQGITVEVELEDGTTLSKSITSDITVERNHIVRLENFDPTPKPLVNNKIYYTAAKQIQLYGSDLFNANIVEHNFDAESGEGVIIFDDELVVIEALAFAKSEFETITLPESLTTIGEYAFGSCMQLVELILPDSVTTIGDEAFSWCSMLERIDLGEGLQSVGTNIFNYSTLLEHISGKGATDDGAALIFDGVLKGYARGNTRTKYSIPEGVTAIEEYAMYNCDYLQEVVIPASVRTIGDRAFTYCDSLVKVHSLATNPPVMEYDDACRAFYENASDRVIHVPAASVELYKSAVGWSTYDTDIVACDCEVADDAELALNQIRYKAAAMVEPYKSDAFNVAIENHTYNADTQEGVISFAGELNVIGEYAFYGKELVEITLPDNASMIAENAFSSCKKLEVVNLPRGLRETRPYAFSGCDALRRFNGENTSEDGRCIIMYDSVLSAFAPADCSQYSIPDGVAIIAEGALSCRGLQGVYIPDSVKSIEKSAFASSAIFDIYVGKSVQYIGEFAFSGCGNLKTVVISDSVTKIDDFAFYESVYMESIHIGDGVKSIGEMAFGGCPNVKELYIGKSVEHIGKDAFFGCPLSSITIPDSVVSLIGAFGGCNNLETFVSDRAIDNGRCLVFDGEMVAFARGGLTSYTIPDSVVSIGEKVFDNCEALVSVLIPTSVTSIGKNAFIYCDALTTIVLPDALTTIEEGAFYFCRSLTEISIPKGVSHIPSEAFYYCTSLANINLSEGVTSIGSRAFYNCDVTEVELPASVERIEYQAFDYCYNLTSVTCKAKTPPVAITNENNVWRAFGSNSSRVSVQVPMDSVALYQAADGWSYYNIEGYFEKGDIVHM